MANTVTELRDRLGLTQEELAANANVSRTLIQRMERGEVPGFRKSIRKVADVLGVTIDDLLAGKAQPDKSGIDELLDQAYALSKRTGEPVEDIIAEMGRAMRSKNQ